MLIILEGQDGVGKTTLAASLVTHVLRQGPCDSITLLHRGPPVAHPIIEYEMPLWDYRPGAGQHIICDRWHIGELVYPELHGRPTQLDRATLTHIEMFLRSRGTLLVHVTAEPHAILDRLGGRALESRPTEVAVNDEGRRFIDACGDSTLPMWYVSTTSDAADETLYPLVSDAMRHEREASPLGKFTTYVGPRDPELLLLGDTRNVEIGNVWEHAPAFVPFPSTSGHYLLKALGSPSHERQIGVANACDVDDPRALWECLGGPETVTLGVNADHRVNWPHRAVPHPQFQRRFHHADGPLYARQILGGGVTS